ncbi:MAG: hypothetical protein Unbinned4294contig1002_14 [Prokaryotic dsDNA virus sp.]|jgi:hypothetical protein|nr:MAG: hypothetical protein Unbinned4294contig1002_14 [Prokaryotic dsDNA virus sp.]|tara:strand:+ start:6098 stop:6349 length:252 start_codon:yes stop_codon:yes gene_type:complete
MTVTERDLANAVFELSAYVSSLPSKEEAEAINSAALKIFAAWIAQQGLPNEKAHELFNSVVAPGPIQAAAEQGRKRWLQRRSS